MDQILLAELGEVADASNTSFRRGVSASDLVALG